MPHLRSEDRILMLGCGNAPISADMYGEGLRRITNVDISDVVIGQMAEKHRDLHEMRWLVADAYRLSETFGPGSYEAVIDKATSDALLAGGGGNISELFTEVAAVLAPGGRFLLV